MNPYFGAQRSAVYANFLRHAEDFRRAYIEYVDSPSGGRRTELMRKLPLAEAACSVAGVVPGLTNPFGDNAIGLTNVCIAFESPRFTIARGSREEIVQMTVDSLDRAIGALSEHHTQSKQREAGLGYRVERFARQLFGFPVRVLGVVLGFNPDDLEGAKARLTFIGSAATTSVLLLGGANRVIEWTRHFGSIRGWW